jgi:phage terminase Nu1 subunit (DNA packaging protein)
MLSCYHGGMMEKSDRNYVIELTGYQAAVFMGVSYSRLQQLLTQENPPPRQPNKTYRSDELGEWVRQRAIMSVTGTGKPGRPPGQRNVMDDDGEGNPLLLSPVQERARKDKEQADKTALENATRRGELVEAATVRRKWVDVMHLVKSKMLRIPFSTAPLLVGQTDQWKIQGILEDQVRDALSELAAGEE